MLDSRRTLDYDSGHLVDLFLNQAEVKVKPAARLLSAPSIIQNFQFKSLLLGSLPAITSF
jgi:hypothetical protein